MSGYVKGRRKQQGRPAEPKNVIDRLLQPHMVVILMMGALYLLFFIGSRTMQTPDGKSMDALLLDGFSLAMFGTLGYMGRNRLRGMRPFVQVIDMFFALSVPPLLIDVAAVIGIYSPASIDAMTRAGVNAAYLLITICAIAALTLTWKEKPSSFYLKAGNIKEGLKTGLIGFAACIALLLIGAFLFYGPIDLSNAAVPMAMLLVFGAAGAIAEELWFRGVLLSRLTPIAGKDLALLAQAIIYGAIQAVILFGATGNILLVPVGLILASALGYYWGSETIKNDSIMGPVLFHAGIDMLIFMPVFMAYL